MPDIDQSIYQPYADQGVRAFGIYRSEPPDLIADFEEQTGVGFPLVADPGYSLGLISFPNGLGYPYPRDVVVDKNLRIRMIRNSFDVDEMEKLVQELLAE